MMRGRTWGMAFLLGALVSPGVAAEPATDRSGDAMLEAYFEAETAKLAEATREVDWRAEQPERRRQLAEMLGLDPLPERTPLEPVVTGVTEFDDIVIEKLHFQSRPGLYVTANFYRPKTQDGPLPAILYVCGHALVKKDGVSFGNKAGYHHHGGWFARNGYVCLTIDTLQLGEIEGIHHGTHRLNRWWWNSRGYTPAGVEAWNGIRALDYLQSRPEVDGEKLGITGRSGGGAYSWFVAALDERIKAAVPVAGITDLENHVVDDCVEGHCDCMFFVNTYRWDYPMLAALVAPRPLLISNTDKDPIFPLEGVVRTHDYVRNVYRQFDAGRNLGLQITEGPHKDTQELRIHAFVWFDRFLKNDGRVIDDPAEKFLEPEQLKVFTTLPGDELNTTIDETFVAKAAAPGVPASKEEWVSQRDGWLAALKEKSFRATSGDAAATLTPVSDLTLSDLTVKRFELTAGDAKAAKSAVVRLPLYTVSREGLGRPSAIRLEVLGEGEWDAFAASFGIDEAGEPRARDDSTEGRFGALKASLKSSDELVVLLPPRGIGPTAWTDDQKERTHIRRRFALLGQTLDEMRILDVRRAMQAVRGVDTLKAAPLSLHGHGDAAGLALYAALFEPKIERVELVGLSASHRQGPELLNVLKTLDLPQTVAIIAERCPVVLHTAEPEAWSYPRSVAEALDWSGDRLTIVSAEAAGE